MALVNTDAIVLRSYNLAEADRIVVCLTKTSGLVRAVARGARRMKSRFGAALEPFQLIRLTFYEKENRELVTISQVEILRSNFNLASEPETSELLAYIAEMVGEFAPPHEANEKLFRLVAACIDALHNMPGSTTVLLRYFEVWLLRLAGLFPDLKVCGRCGNSVSPNGVTCLDFEGRALCDNCNRDSATRLSADTQRMILAIQQLSPVQFAESFAQLSKVTNEQLGEITHRLITRALDKRPRTLIASSSV